MDTQPPTARLMGRSGDLAGSTFDLGHDSTIGRDDGNRVAVNAPTFSKRLARIYVEEGSYYLEDLGGRTRVDGNPVKGPIRLGRLHVIELGDGMEAVFTQVAAPPASQGSSASAGTSSGPGTPDTPPKPAPPPPAAPSEPPAKDPPGDPDPGHTVLDMAGFGALPDLPRGKGRPSDPPGDRAKEAEKGEAEPGAKEARGGDEVDPGHTILDMAGFGALPDLGHGKKPAEEPREPGETPKEPPKQKPADPEPPPAGGPPPGSDPGQTILDMAGFGGLPDLSKGEDTPGTRDDDPQATRAVPRPPRFQLAVSLPGRGPTTFPLKLGDNVLGRSEECEVTVFDPEMWVSRRHAIVRVRPDRVELEDLKGVNGTFVDGQRIDTVPLAPGSTFTLGPNLTFTLQEI